jgi:hypothetical protein
VHGLIERPRTYSKLTFIRKPFQIDIHTTVMGSRAEGFKLIISRPFLPRADAAARNAALASSRLYRPPRRSGGWIGLKEVKASEQPGSPSPSSG